MLGYLLCILSWYHVNSDDNLEMAIILNCFTTIFFKEHLLTHNEGRAPNANEMGTIGVKFYFIFFIRKNEVHVTLKVQCPELKVLCKESMRNVSVLMCCGMNCC